jgi:hypothetical protein
MEVGWGSHGLNGGLPLYLYACNVAALSDPTPSVPCNVHAPCKCVAKE